MAHSMKGEADKSRSDKMRAMQITTAELGNDMGAGHVMPQKDGTQGEASGGYAKGYKRGGRVDSGEAVEGKKSKPRLDRGKFASGGNVGKAKKKSASTTVNVIVASPRGAASSSPPQSPAAPMGASPSAPPMPAQAGPGAPMPPGMGMPMRKRGGRVGYPKMEAGAGSGEGRMEKVEEYGANAKPKK